MWAMHVLHTFAILREADVGVVSSMHNTLIDLLMVSSDFLLTGSAACMEDVKKRTRLEHRRNQGKKDRRKQENKDPRIHTQSY